MALRFEWDPDKARRNLRKHRLSFEEATTAFEDDRSLTTPDPAHSVGEERFLLLGRTGSGRIVVVAFTERTGILTPSASSQPASPTAASATTMKKAKRKTASPRRPAAEDDLLPHYDFRGGVRGKYAARYREGTNVVVLAPDVAARFPDSAAVNRALRALAEVADATTGKPRSRRRTA